MEEKIYKISKTQRHKVNALAWRLRDVSDIDWNYDNIDPVDVQDAVFDVLDDLQPIERTGDEPIRLMLQPVSGWHHTTQFLWTKANSEVSESPEPIADDDDKIFDYIKVPKTAIGIWQSFVLRSLWCTKLPLFDHSNYHRIQLILSEKDMPVINNDGAEYCSAPKGADVSFKEEYLPHVVMRGDRTSCLYFHYFNEWMGVVKCHHEITVSESGKIQFGEAVTEVIIPYNCGICF